MVIRHVMLVNWKRATRLHLVVGAQINHRADTEAHNVSGVIGSQSIQTIGTKQRPPPCLSTVDGRIAAKITKVVHGEQRHYPSVVVEDGA